MLSHGGRASLKGKVSSILLSALNLEGRLHLKWMGKCSILISWIMFLFMGVLVEGLESVMVFEVVLERSRAVLFFN